MSVTLSKSVTNLTAKPADGYGANAVNKGTQLVNSASSLAQASTQQSVGNNQTSSVDLSVFQSGSNQIRYTLSKVSQAQAMHADPNAGSMASALQTASSQVATLQGTASSKSAEASQAFSQAQSFSSAANSLQTSATSLLNQGNTLLALGLHNNGQLTQAGDEAYHYLVQGQQLIASANQMLQAAKEQQDAADAATKQGQDADSSANDATSKAQNVIALGLSQASGLKTTAISKTANPFSGTTSPTTTKSGSGKAINPFASPNS